MLLPFRFPVVPVIDHSGVTRMHTRLVEKDIEPARFLAWVNSWSSIHLIIRLNWKCGSSVGFAAFAAASASKKFGHLCLTEPSTEAGRGQPDSRAVRAQ